MHMSGKMQRSVLLGRWRQHLRMRVNNVFESGGFEEVKQMSPTMIVPWELFSVSNILFLSFQELPLEY